MINSLIEDQAPIVDFHDENQLFDDVAYDSEDHQSGSKSFS
jgi:hypothetical protein